MDSEFKQRFDDLDKEVAAVQGHGNSLVGRLDGIDKRLSGIDKTLREMRRENEEAHAEIGRNITRETVKLREDMESGFKAVGARFDRVEGEISGLTIAMGGVVDILKSLAPKD